MKRKIRVYGWSNVHQDRKEVCLLGELRESDVHLAPCVSLAPVMGN
jgi:hypothetical protein